MTTARKCEIFLELLAIKHHPRLKRGLKIKLNPRSRYVFKARKNGNGVKAEVGFLPGAPNWEAHLTELCRAAMSILDGRTHAIASGQLTAFEVSLRLYEEDCGLVEAGYYLPKGPR